VRRSTIVTALATSVMTLAGVLGAVPTSSAATSTASAAPAGRAVAARPAPLGHYTPPAGVRFNDPLGDKAARRQIIGHLLRTIDSVPRGAQIRIASWNIRSGELASALVRAHRRGVSVRVVMDRGNANETNPNPSYTQMATAFRKGQATRKPAMKSWARRCISSCRAAHGIAHTKFFLFSKAGNAHDVVMYGSANATDLSAYAQWNDLYTIPNSRPMYDDFLGVFDQMALDRTARQPYLTYAHGRYTSYFYPYKGAGTTHDPILRELNRIQCAGATGGTGTNGFTKVRIAQTSMHGERGKAIAGRLVQMQNRGCDIKIVYAVFGNEVMDVLRHAGRRPVPFVQIAQDPNADGVYDRYLHMKSMAVSGNYAGVTNANVTWNGSANWTAVSLASDEIVMKVVDPVVRKQYSQWIDWLFAHPPLQSAARSTAVRTALRSATARGVDPYAQMQLD
jgi:hypothetical protein